MRNLSMTVRLSCHVHRVSNTTVTYNVPTMYLTLTYVHVEEDPQLWKAVNLNLAGLFIDDSFQSKVQVDYVDAELESCSMTHASLWFDEVMAAKASVEEG